MVHNILSLAGATLIVAGLGAVFRGGGRVGALTGGQSGFILLVF